MAGSIFIQPADSTRGPNFRATAKELFDDLGKTYEDSDVNNEAKNRSLDWLISQLPKGAVVLDMGCGSGIPAAKVLTDAGFAVTGIDISPVMLSHARASVPRATFIEADILDYTPQSGVDAILVLFGLINGVSQLDISDFFVKAYSYLNPGGCFVFVTVPLDCDEVVGKWMGREAYCSGFSTANTLAEIKGAGFEVLKYEECSFLRPQMSSGEQAIEEPHLFVYAKKISK